MTSVPILIGAATGATGSVATRALRKAKVASYVGGESVPCEAGRKLGTTETCWHRT